MKKRVSATLDPETIKAVENYLKNSRYRNKSHIIEEAIIEFLERKKKKND